VSPPAPDHPHAVQPGDEQRHRPGDEELWNESYYLDFVSGGGDLAGYVRIGLYPNLGVTWWTTMVVGEGRPLLASVGYDLPLPGGTGLEVAAAGTEVRATVVRPLEEMTVQGSAPAVTLEGAGSVYEGSAGEPTALELDLSWKTDGVPFHYDLTTRYEIPCLVAGEIVVGGERAVVEGHGQRDHSWGVRDWWAFGWCWSAARLDDGTRVHAADIRIPGSPVAFGYVQHPDGRVDPVETLAVTEVLGEGGMPSRATIEIQPGPLVLEVLPIAFGPLVLTAPDGRISRFPRAAARFTAADGRAGTGWIEWNQPGRPAVGR
jgi:hypothetical protein